MSSSGSRDRAGDRLSPLESVVTDSAHEHSRFASGQSRSSLDNPQPDSTEFQHFARREVNFRDFHGSPDESTEGTSNSTAPASFGVNDTHYSGRRLGEDETKRERYKQLGSAQMKLKEQRQVLSRLKAWHDWDENRHKSLRNYILSRVGYPRRPSLPGRNELSQLALCYFPPRMKLKVILCDYGPDRFERFEVELGRIESGTFLISA